MLSVPFVHSPLGEALEFVRRHPLVFFGLGGIAAIGRSLQVGAAGPISAGTNVSLEVVVEGSRVILLLSALGGGQVGKGWRTLRRWFDRRPGERASAAAPAPLSVRTVVIQIVMFLAFAGVANGLIWLLVHQTDVLSELQQHGVVAATAPANVLTLFLKNFSVIPFTIVLVAMFARRWRESAAGD